MNPPEIKIHASSRPWDSRVDLVIIQGSAAMTNAVFEQHTDGAQVDPSLSIPIEAAQVLMEQLWSIGIRPSDMKLETGALGATKAHLEDMRKIAFKFLPKD